jgi:histidyl-tRNA synthetase
MTISVPRGTKDILPDEVHLWQSVESKAKALFEAYSYNEIRTPLFESSELFLRGIGEESDIVSKEMYSFTDRSNRELTLRPEGTASVARAYINHNLHRHQAKSKFFYSGPMFRYERPQAGRYRQFHQMGIENIGSAHPSSDAEVISMAYQLFKSLGLNGLSVTINTIGDLSSRPKIGDLVKKHVSEKDTSDFDDTFFDTLNKNPLRLLDSKSKKIQALFEDFPDIYNVLNEESKNHFDQVCNYLKLLKVPFIINSKLVRGLDYYAHTVFEIVSDDLGAQSTVCGGGRYDNLIKELGGPQVPAVGFAFGMERLISLLETQSIKFSSRQSIYVAPLDDTAYEQALSACQHLRLSGIHCVLEDTPLGLGAHLKKANKLKINTVLIFGEDEIKNKTATLKDLSNSSQKTVSIDDLKTVIKGQINV